MSDESPLHAVPEALRDALAARGITHLTPVQTAVLGAEVGRDLRISSQTGSGKTVAFGLVLARDLPAAPRHGNAPRALVLVPTRELAQQVRRELAWLLAPVGMRVLSVTGGTSVRGDLRALDDGADVVVGTPGRLADHVRSGAVTCEHVAAVVLDEADEMLDMGFAEELATVLDQVPEQRRMHLVSATFGGAVAQLADEYQREPVSVQGTPIGDANADIDHVVHLVLPHERVDALVNVLLLAPDEPTLIFARTREGAASLSRTLREVGLDALLLTGELEQRERQRTLEAFRNGRIRILVATDVAARGLDIPAITRVVHSDPPEDPDAYTHRSGRTGRAGRKGVSHVLLPREARARVQRLLSRAGVSPRFAPVPGPDEIVQAAEERAIAAIRDDDTPIDDQATRLATRLLESIAPEVLVARLLSRPVPRLPAEPRTVTPIVVEARPTRKRADGAAPASHGSSPTSQGTARGFVQFQVSWGAKHGADARRLLALLCRRGGISREHVGAIAVGPLSCHVEIRADIADAFEQAASQPDPRDPRVKVRRARSQGASYADSRPAPPSHRPPPRRDDPRRDDPRPDRRDRPARNDLPEREGRVDRPGRADHGDHPRRGQRGDETEAPPHRLGRFGDRPDRGAPPPPDSPGDRPPTRGAVPPVRRKGRG